MSARSKRLAASFLLSAFAVASATYGCSSTTNASEAEPAPDDEKELPPDESPNDGEDAGGKSKDAGKKDASKAKDAASPDDEDDGDKPQIPAGVDSYVAGTLTLNGKTTVNLDPPATVEAVLGIFSCSTTAYEKNYSASVGWDVPSTPSVGTYKAVPQGQGVMVMVGLPNGKMSSVVANVNITKADKTNNVFEGTVTDLKVPFTSDNVTITAKKLWFHCEP